LGQTRLSSESLIEELLGREAGMKRNCFLMMAVFAFLVFTARNAAAQQPASTTGVPVHMVVTVEARKG
jgi:hypothetical protein